MTKSPNSKVSPDKPADQYLQFKISDGAINLKVGVCIQIYKLAILALLLKKQVVSLSVKCDDTPTFDSVKSNECVFGC